jgi:predicted ATPase
MKKQILHLDGPLLDQLTVSLPSSVDALAYPFSLEIIQNLKDLKFPTQVTFLVGENGSGKSTILQALANKAGFGAEGGSKNIHFQTAQEKNYSGASNLAECMTLSWRHKPAHGYFFRAESFFNLASHVDTLAAIDARAYNSYGGKSLHAQSHGESFLSFFKNSLSKDAFFILYEHEAALSPQRQLSLLLIMHELCTTSHAQFITATHSPILLAYPNATIYSCDEQTIQKIAYKDTKHYQITKEFLDNPERYLHHLLNS